MFISQKTEVHQYHYPFAEKINPVLHRFICEHSYTEDPYVPGAEQIPFDYKPLLDLKEFQLIIDYAKSLILNMKSTPVSDQIPWSLELLTWWGQLYNRGSFQAPHHHNPTHWAFVYYVNTPRGSSPLIFEAGNKKIDPTEGDLILFPAWLTHFVPPNKCEGRSVIVGNFYWKTQ